MSSSQFWLFSHPLFLAQRTVPFLPCLSPQSFCQQLPQAGKNENLSHFCVCFCWVPRSLWCSEESQREKRLFPGSDWVVEGDFKALWGDLYWQIWKEGKLQTARMFPERSQGFSCSCRCILATQNQGKELTWLLCLHIDWISWTWNKPKGPDHLGVDQQLLLNGYEEGVLYFWTVWWSPREDNKIMLQVPVSLLLACHHAANHGSPSRAHCRDLWEGIL